MKLKLSEVHQKALKLSNFNKELPVRVQFNLSKNKKLLQAEFNAYIEQRKELEKKYLTFDENDKPISDEKGELVFNSDENKTEYIKELKSLMDLEVDINFVNLPLNLIENISMTTDEFETIEFMFNE